MDIFPPTILSSNLVTTPFIFGRRSNKAILAIPKDCQRIEDDKNVLLLHELAHIRNHDVGFLAWSNACLRDLRLLFMLLPTLIIYCYSLSYSYTIPSIILYLTCSFILFVMFRYVVRKRETLADMTAALLIKSGNVRDVIFEQEIHTIKSHINSDQIAKLKLTDKIQRWLTDKALFSTKQWLWKVLLWIFNFFHTSHPSNSERIRIISTQNDIAQHHTSPLSDSFWAGVALGFLGVIIGLSGYWLAVFIQKTVEETNVVRLPFDLYGMVSPMPLFFLAIFLALPAWSSLKLPTLDRHFFLLLLARYAMALVGAYLICPLILIAGAVNQDVLVLLVICILWYIFIIVFSFSIYAIIISLWVTIRYFQSSHITELRNLIWELWLFIIAVFSLTLFGMILLYNEITFPGINIIFSIVTGGTFASLTMGKSNTSKTDQYIILRIPFLVYRFEGKRIMAFTWAIHSFSMTALLFIFASLMYLIIHFVFGKILHNLDFALGILIAIAACCTVIVIHERHGISRISERKRSKIFNLHHCLKLLSKPIDSKTRIKVNKVAASYDLGTKGSKDHILYLTMHDAYEAISLILDDTSQSRILDHISKWILKCQRQGGFGIWPTGSPRLYSTYQAILILRDANLLDKCNTDLNISWIKTFQQPDGSFKGPYSKRSAWEDTFFAVKSIEILGSSLNPEESHLCRTWCIDILLENGLSKNRPDVIYYCFGALTALGTVDDSISKSVSDWLSSAIEELLLTNISLNYENVHFSVMVYHLLNTIGKTPSEHMNLLTDRINLALTSELANIHV